MSQMLFSISILQRCELVEWTLGNLYCSKYPASFSYLWCWPETGVYIALTLWPYSSAPSPFPASGGSQTAPSVAGGPARTGSGRTSGRSTDAWWLKEKAYYVANSHNLTKCLYKGSMKGGILISAGRLHHGSRICISGWRGEKTRDKQWDHILYPSQTNVNLERACIKVCAIIYIEYGIYYVYHTMFLASYVQIYWHTITSCLFAERFRGILGVKISQKVPGRIEKSIHRVRLTFSKTITVTSVNNDVRRVCMFWGHKNTTCFVSFKQWFMDHVKLSTRIWKHWQYIIMFSLQT